jgi:hypothetical protein
MAVAATTERDTSSLTLNVLTTGQTILESVHFFLPLRQAKVSTHIPPITPRSPSSPNEGNPEILGPPPEFDAVEEPIIRQATTVPTINGRAARSI